MDPKETLGEIRLILARVDHWDFEANDSDSIAAFDDARRLAELVQALDDWMARGGFSPWHRCSITAELPPGIGLARF